MTAGVTQNWDLLGAVEIKIGRHALIPNLNVTALAVTEVFNAPLGADYRVITPIIGGEVALLVRGQHPGLHAHKHHGNIFNINNRV